MVIYLSLLIALVGGAVYLLLDPNKPIKARVSELGRLSFAVGLLAYLFQTVAHFVVGNVAVK